ncbi:50S ribosomal protein L19-1, chloroplastic-like isoform X2 [Pistacia vera]|uniref:50S ribosomal protein L19-1, chloroplastic-like isoform X2 n=1 Tax=Pistacia vera TaxID=55513 RepID=UPI00126304F5|nr:50S ribosomal protein L19-1, chloroplastic-like isoform X2 [Pistacia vera]
MQAFRGSIRLVQRHNFTKGFASSNFMGHPFDSLKNSFLRSLHEFASCSQVKFCSQTESLTSLNYYGRSTRAGLFQQGIMESTFASRCLTTMGNSDASASQDFSAAPRIKFKRLDKTARHIMQILDKEAVEEVKGQREIPDIKPGYIVQFKVEVPENKRRVSVLKGIVIARRNAGPNTTFRIRRLVAGVGVESLYPLYSPNIKEIKVLDKKKVRRAKLYYLRDRMNPLKK